METIYCIRDLNTGEMDMCSSNKEFLLQMSKFSSSRTAIEEITEKEKREYLEKRRSGFEDEKEALYGTIKAIRNVIGKRIID